MKLNPIMKSKGTGKDGYSPLREKAILIRNIETILIRNFETI